MKRVAVVGPYGIGPEFTTGQAVKCFETINWMKTQYGDTNVFVVNTYMWKKNPFKLFFRMIKAFINCNNVIIMPAENGAKVFIPMSYYLKRIWGRQVHYIVIGGWIKDSLEKSAWLYHAASSFEGIYVETKSMVQQLKSLGLNNTVYLPNFRKLLNEKIDKPSEWTEPIPVCTYSRVTKDKGIPDAIEIVKMANDMLKRKVFKLDIYGKVASEFHDEFMKLLDDNADIVTYCGIKNADEGMKTLAPYYALLFPTYYAGEGFAGTVLDAFASGTPTIANDWKYNSEVINSGGNGYIYSFCDNKRAAECLVELFENKEKYDEIKKGCMESALVYSTDVVLKQVDCRLTEGQG